MSDQKLDFRNIVVGPFEASKNKSDYDADEEYGAQELVEEALAWTESNSFDFSQCDGNNDGIIDAISLFYAGEMGEGAGEALLSYTLGVDPGQTAVGDLYVVVVIPGGVVASFHPDGITVDISPYSQATISTIDEKTLIALPASSLPAGTYSFLSVITPPGVSPMDSSKWIDFKILNFDIN